MEKVSLDISRDEELSKTVKSFPVLYDKSQKGFKEKDSVKNAWDRVATAFESILLKLFYFIFRNYRIHLA